MKSKTGLVEYPGGKKQQHIETRSSNREWEHTQKDLEKTKEGLCRQKQNKGGICLYTLNRTEEGYNCRPKPRVRLQCEDPSQTLFSSPLLTPREA
jgi:hypothetical protein